MASINIYSDNTEKENDENQGAAAMTSAKHVLQTPAKSAFKDVTNRAENLGSAEEAEGNRWRTVKKGLKERKNESETHPAPTIPASAPIEAPIDLFDLSPSYAACAKHSSVEAFWARAFEFSDERIEQLLAASPQECFEKEKIDLSFKDVAIEPIPETHHYFYPEDNLSFPDYPDVEYIQEDLTFVDTSINMFNNSSVKEASFF